MALFDDQDNKFIEELEKNYPMIEDGPVFQGIFTPQNNHAEIDQSPFKPGYGHAGQKDVLHFEYPRIQSRQPIDETLITSEIQAPFEWRIVDSGQMAFEDISFDSRNNQNPYSQHQFVPTQEKPESTPIAQVPCETFQNPLNFQTPPHQFVIHQAQPVSTPSPINYFRISGHKSHLTTVSHGNHFKPVNYQKHMVLQHQTCSNKQSPTPQKNWSNYPGFDFEHNGKMEQNGQVKVNFGIYGGFKSDIGPIRHQEKMEMFQRVDTNVQVDKNGIPINSKQDNRGEWTGLDPVSDVSIEFLPFPVDNNGMEFQIEDLPQDNQTTNEELLLMDKREKNRKDQANCYNRKKNAMSEAKCKREQLTAEHERNEKRINKEKSQMIELLRKCQNDFSENFKMEFDEIMASEIDSLEFFKLKIDTDLATEKYKKAKSVHTNRLNDPDYPIDPKKIKSYDAKLAKATFKTKRLKDTFEFRLDSMKIEFEIQKQEKVLKLMADYRTSYFQQDPNATSTQWDPG